MKKLNKDIENYKTAASAAVLFVARFVDKVLDLYSRKRSTIVKKFHSENEFYKISLKVVEDWQIY